MRVRTGGSHHQKLRRHPAPRRPDPRHRLRRRHRPVPLAPRRRGPRTATRRPRTTWPRSTATTPPWHDIQAAISGPAVHDVETVFRERWEDPTTLSRSPVILLRDRLRGLDTTPDPLPEQAPPPPPVEGGTHVVQLLRTYPNLRRGRDYAFARGGERSVARGYTKAVERARHLVYVEDQYLWGDHVGDVFTEALQTPPRPARDRGGADVPGRRGASAGPPSWSAGAGRCSTWRGPRRTGWRSTASRTTPALRSTCTPRPAWSTTPGRRSAPTTSTAAPGPTTPSCRRSWWTPPGDYARTPAARPRRRAPRPRPRRPGRLRGRRPACSRRTPTRAAALDGWHAGGEAGPRPPGRLRRLQPPELGRVTRAARAAGSTCCVHDPDGRPKPLRKRDEF